jgi:chromosome segregation ATPase
MVLWFITERVAELEATVKSLETQLQEQEEEANNVISQWQESCTASDDKCSELEQKLEEEELKIAQETLARDEDVVHQWEGRCKAK